MDDRNFDLQTAQDWIHSVEKPGPSWRDENVYLKLSRLIREASPRTILDLGCGQGICSEKIEFGPCKYTGVEPSPFLLDRAKSLYESKNRNFLLGNAYDLPVPNESHDAAFSILVWHLLMDLEKAASELSRVLVDEGHFFIVTANPDAYSAWKSFYPDAKVTGKKLEGTMQLGNALSRDVLHLHTLSEIKESLQNVGLEIEKTETFLAAKDAPNVQLLISIQGRKVIRLVR
jgi:ubiquinone/menaquinone biosynthesis C-methylase UbiE